jgi:hypothetical protein
VKRPGVSFGSRLDRRNSAKRVFEKLRLILAVEADLKPNTASGVHNRVERGWLDVAVI